MLMKAIGQLLKTQKITVKRVIKKNTKGGKRIGSGRKMTHNGICFAKWRFWNTTYSI
jgi:hypothetical protein